MSMANSLMLDCAEGEDGFTLVEVIVALAILALGIGGLTAMISTSLQQTAVAARTSEAGSLAQSLLARVGRELPIREEEQQGEFANGYGWTLRTSIYGDAREREEWPVGAYKIFAQVEWQDGGMRRVYALETLRLGPKAARP
jgi:general secretion pathway protein I